MKKTKIDHYTDKEALDFHKEKKPGKIEIISSKNMTTKRDLALAYSPGVAAPVKIISENPEASGFSLIIFTGAATPGEYASARSLLVVMFFDEIISIFPGFFSLWKSSASLSV